MDNMKAMNLAWLGAKYKNAVLAILIAASCSLTLYFHMVRKSCILFTHFFYIPIILAGLWWRKKGIVVAVFLAALLVSTHIIFMSYESIAEDCIRALMFVVIAFIVGTLSERIMKVSDILKNTRNYLDKLIDYASAPIIVWDPMLNITRFNRAFEHLTGYTANEIVGHKIESLFSEANRDDSMQKIACTSEGEHWDSVEIPILCRNGDTRLALWNSANIYMKDNKTLLATIAQGIDITERKHMEEQIKASLKEKEVLLKEMYHRVKNNLQVISSLMGLQSRHITDKQILDTLRKSQNHVRSIALVHEKLYQSKNLLDINLGGYIKELLDGLIQSYGVEVDKITLKTDIDDIPLGTDIIIHSGLIINELVSNSLKHAFPGGGEGEIRISLHSIDADYVELKVSDNGVGIPLDTDFRKTESLGLQLVTTLVEDQLEGEIELVRRGGTEFRIKFRKTNNRVG